MRIFCSGIGGIGLSAYAAYRRAEGHEVFGSDRADSPLLEDLRSQGIAVSLVQDGTALPQGIDLFVYTEAVSEHAPERRLARERGIRSISYFAALGELSQDHFVIAVCGTHGKSSTTAMIAKILLDCGRDPSVIVGTKMRELGGRNWRRGASDIFVVEACEYRRSFHHLSPDVVVVTNADGDHFDAYKDITEYEQAFVDFFRLLPEDGDIVFHGQDAQVASLVSQSGRKGHNADVLLEPQLATPGGHMRRNGQLAIMAAVLQDIAEPDARAALTTFSGTWRRMEVLGELPGGVTVVDDYGHHPVEVRATLAAMREAYPKRRIVCVFQHHTHDRALSQYEAFTRAFGDADVLLLPDVYVARKDIEHGTLDLPTFAKDTAAASACEVMLSGSMDETEGHIAKTVKPGDVLVCMGAGSIGALAPKLLAKTA